MHNIVYADCGMKFHVLIQIGASTLGIPIAKPGLLKNCNLS